MIWAIIGMIVGALLGAFAIMTYLMVKFTGIKPWWKVWTL